MRYILEVVADGFEMPLAEAQDFEATLFGLVASTDDMREGTRAFLEKRKAAVPGGDRFDARRAAACDSLSSSRGSRLRHRAALEGARAALREPACPTTPSTSAGARRLRDAPAAASASPPSGAGPRPSSASGCLIRGETPHFDYIASAASHGIMRAAAATGVPVAFGVLTTNSAEEAIARAGDGDGQQGARSGAGGLRDGPLFQTLEPRP